MLTVVVAKAFVNTFVLVDVHLSSSNDIVK